MPVPPERSLERPGPRLVVGEVRPRTPAGEHPAKGTIGEPVTLSADIFGDGHDRVAARSRWRPVGERKWREEAMAHAGNDRWEADVEPSSLGLHEFVVEAWTDRVATWQHDVELKHGAGHDIGLEL